MKYNWFKPLNSKNLYNQNLSDCISANAMTMANKTYALEKKLKRFLNVKYAILTTSGTSALQLATIASGIKKNDLVYAPNFTWVATTNPAKLVDANIQLIDSEKLSQKIKFNELNKKINKKKPKLVFLVHMNGEANYDSEFNKLKNKYKFFVIEDGAQSFLSKDNKKISVGTRYDIGCFSLSMTKPINMIYGGCCVTNSKKLAIKLLSARNNGLSSIYWYKKNEIATNVGLNLKPSDLHSAIGLINFNKKKIIIKKNKLIYNYYKKNLKNKKIVFQEIEGKYTVVCWPQIFVDNKKKFVNYCKNNHIEIHTGMRCLSETIPLKNNISKFPNSIFLSRNLVRLPSGPGYKLNDIIKITNIINDY